MFTSIIIVIGIIILLAYAERSPSDFHVERSVIVLGLPEQIFPLINDFHRWKEWSPHLKYDPNMVVTFTGTEYGAGAVYEWSGKGKAGAGRMEIVKVSEPMRVSMTLDISKPVKGHNKVIFSIDPTDDGTLVTWAMDGKNSFIVKLVGQFIDMDKMIGKDFEEGLLNIKTLVEPPPEEE